MTTTITPTELTQLRAVVSEFIDERVPELLDWINSRAKARRSSMPIYLDDVAVLVMATMALPDLIDCIEQYEAPPCGQVSALLVGRLSGPCVVRGRHTGHRADNGDAWTESVR